VCIGGKLGSIVMEMGRDFEVKGFYDGEEQ
jgi:hypothetical protein